MTGAKDGRTSWSRLVGIGSRRHVDFEDLLMMDITSEDVVGLQESNLKKMEPVENLVVGSEAEVLKIPRLQVHS